MGINKIKVGKISSFLRVRLDSLKTGLASFVFIVGVGVFIFGLYHSSLIQNNRYFKALRYEKIAKKFPPSNQMAIRLKAMAKALKEGKNEYTYTNYGFGPTPSLPINFPTNSKNKK